MPAFVSPPRAATGPDDLDDIFNYDAGLDDAARAGQNDENTQPNGTSGQGNTTTQVNDVDEEVVITRRRQPIAKLDEPRLLSSAGIPRLQKIAKSMRYKGKGHEFSDMSRVLHMYQLWLDDLYPRAKFADGLTIIEKLGHKKTLQMYRKGWIDEGKSKPAEDDLNERLEDEQMASTAAPTSGAAAAAAAGVEANGSTDHPAQREDNDAPDEDELDALMAEAEQADQARPSQPARSNSPNEQDELDMLLAEAEAEEIPRARPTQSEQYDDDEEAMAEMGW